MEVAKFNSLEPAWYMQAVWGVSSLVHAGSGEFRAWYVQAVGSLEPGTCRQWGVSSLVHAGSEESRAWYAGADPGFSEGGAKSLPPRALQ
jgi:hypothetical protein